MSEYIITIEKVLENAKKLINQAHIVDEAERFANRALESLDALSEPWSKEAVINSLTFIVKSDLWL